MVIPLPKCHLHTEGISGGLVQCLVGTPERLASQMKLIRHGRLIADGGRAKNWSICWFSCYSIKSNLVEKSTMGDCSKSLAEIEHQA